MQPETLQQSMKTHKFKHKTTTTPDHNLTLQQYWLNVDDTQHWYYA